MTQRRVHPCRIALVLLGGIAITVGVLWYHLRDPAAAGESQFMPKCLWYEGTGLYCPGCGSGRALHALTHGRLREAASLSPFFVICLPVFVYWALASALEWTGVGRLPTPTLKAWMIWVIFFAISAYWVLRNVPVWPFRLLAPGGW